MLQIQAKYPKGDEQEALAVTMMRTDAPHGKQTVSDDETRSFFTILGGGVSYLMYLEDTLPSTLALIGHGVTK